MSLLDEITTGVLAEEIEPFKVARRDMDIYNILNRKDIPAKGILTVHFVKKFLSLIGLRLPILDSTEIACRKLVLALEDFKESGFDLSDPQVYAAVETTLTELESATLTPAFTEGHKAYLLASTDTLISIADQLGGVSLSALADELNKLDEMN